MSRFLITSCLCLFATAALAVPPVDKCNKIATRTSPVVAPVAAPAPAPAPAVASIPTTDINSHRTATSAAGAPHAAQPRTMSPRWHSFLPGMFR